MYIAADLNTYEIITTKLCSSNVTTDEVLSNFIKHTRRSINEISDGSA
ncbi:hypothetical protein BTN50_0887 [Candidatus Enterovibrio altilux]|uniref:Mobile element protein n=1 Tax=Candidatus Enterovibrio altilux TaxID=1927128 RepID=A0A291B8R1_9GAMM|nr:hypothetical protein BTN50_0887 [Candidatus Enterovibrio luxaltus]